MTRDADRSSRTHRVKRAPGARPSVGRPIMTACADQTTNRLWVLKTGSALMNRRIKARMLRAFRMAFSRSTITLTMRKRSAGFIFLGAALRRAAGKARAAPVGTSFSILTGRRGCRKVAKSHEDRNYFWQASLELVLRSLPFRKSLDNLQCTNPPRGSSVDTTSQSHAELITAVATWRSTIFSITVARYEQHKTFRILYPARG